MGSKPSTYIVSLGSIAIAYGMENMAGEDGKDSELTKLEPLGSQNVGIMPTYF